MKKSLIYLLLLISISIHSQDFAENKIITIITAPGAYDDGFNIGAQFEYTNKTIYVGPELFVFPNLNHSKKGDYPYYHLVGRFGLNHYIKYGITDIIRLSSGVRAGGILRTDADGTNKFYQLLGFEAGVQFILWEQVLIGASITSDMKNDSKMYSNDDKHTVNSVFISVGFKF